MENLIEQLKTANVYLKESEIIGILYILKNQSGIENNELIRITGITKEILKQFKTSIQSLLDSSNKDRIFLNSLGVKVLSDLSLLPHNWSLLEYSDTKETGELDNIRLKNGLSYINSKREFDQFFATSASSISKIQLFTKKGLGTNLRIATLGDDDLISIAFNLKNISYSEFQIFEIDTGLVSSIEAIKDAMSIKNVHICNQDLRLDFQKQYLNKYDVVFIDPPYTREGLQLFLHRSIELLKPYKNTNGSYIFLNFGVGRKNTDKQLKVQEVIQSFNLIIEDKISNFTHYYGAETVGSSSDIYILKTTPFTSIANSVLTDSIYTYESEPEEKFPYVDHFVAKIKKVPTDILLSKSALTKAAGTICNKHKLRVLDTKITKFKNNGYTITYVLATSNLVIHTWPEYNSIHIDLITCSPIHNKENLGQTFSKAFNTTSVYIQKIS